MKKIKLSEISVNATTLANQNSEFYNFRKFGLGESTNNVFPLVTDCNIDITTGFYSAAPYALNAPESVYFVLIVIKRGTGHTHQLALGSNGNIHYRAMADATWGSWRKLSMI